MHSAIYIEGDKNEEVVKLLLDAGADPNAVNNDAIASRTPLSMACRHSIIRVSRGVSKISTRKWSNR
ncbi:ankyrin repeat domain-containing protein [Wolbachia endosymbiont of Mansonella perstans]|nr:ankyrin repeat domain-containing protein [Wolbachia endosymbiont of Mansonella perstans]